MIPDTARWSDLPPGVRAAVEDHAGHVTEDELWGEGLGTSLRLSLTTASGKVFVKGAAPGDPARRHRKLDAGAALTPYVEQVAPRLLWHVKHDGWNLAGYQRLPGRPWADQGPGSPDIPGIAGVLRELTAIPAPATLTETVRECYEAYADDPGALDGDRLVHRDPNPCNFVTDGHRTWLVDWGWAARGPAWVTPALLVLSMMESGWEPGAAEHALAPVPGWKDAPPHALASFADAHARMWEESLAGAPENKVFKFRAGIARTYARHRTPQPETTAP